MSETTTTSSELTSQYSAQVAKDLALNVQEQERVSGEIAALRQQLAALEQDHTVLVSIQRAIGAPATAPAPAAEPEAAVPAPRRKTSAASGTGRGTGSRTATGRGGQSKAAKATKSTKPPAPARRRAAKKNDAAPAGKPAATRLVDIVRAHLTDQREPRSAAEITGALAQQHPERGIKPTAVRTTLEGLVAKNQAQRTKQGTSVFYTAPDAPEPAAAQGTKASESV